ncbi:MAG: LD-carboxypeptidase [Bacteroidetes bacterium]|nr:MAG: LD-carboxypeptidase [Bacteroidota bacterium]
MNRKNFISLFALSASVPWKGWKGLGPIAIDNRLIPPYLRPGDTIGITCPAGNITLPEIQSAMQEIENWGFKIRLGDTVGKKDFTFGGTDAERAADFQQMMDDPSLKAILCARGGYGAIRIVDRLNFTTFKDRPKWIIGFSDITVLHCHLSRNWGIASIHSKMCNSFPDDWSKAEPVQIESIKSIRLALEGQKMKYEISAGPYNRIGSAEGVLVGGNLKTIETLSCTKSDIITDNRILFVEDTGEYLYSIDRMFWNLKRTGKLDKLAGLIIGGFKIKPDDPGEEFGKTLYDIVLEKVKDYSYPICFDFPVGHQKDNYALKCGVKHRLEVNADKAVLVESELS